MYIVNTRFEWDQNKGRINAQKHGISFKEAATAFHDPEAMTADDPIHSNEEPRHWLVGESDRKRLLVVIFTERPVKAPGEQDPLLSPGISIRIISARLALRRERRRYEENRGISF